MALKSDASYSEFWNYPSECLPAVEPHPVGICEVVSVGAADELPYVFELTGEHRLSFSISASHDIDVVLCNEESYDQWIDNGLQLEHPPNPILTLRHGRQHSLEFRPELDTTLIAILINLADREVHAVVAATVLDSSGAPC